MSGHKRDSLDDMMDSLDEFWLYEQMTKDDDDDVNLDFDDDFELDDDTDAELDDADFVALEKNYTYAAPYKNEDPKIYNDFFDGKNAGYERGYELGFFAGYDTGKYALPDKIPESPKPKGYAFSNGFRIGFVEGYDKGYEEGCRRSGHASELERLKRPPYTKEKYQPMQTETAVNTKIIQPAIDNSIK